WLFSKSIHITQTDPQVGEEEEQYCQNHL
ncbi:hypothetical protein A2U01_0049759, partial [Trifolium medium]|nr:hypothetical protein [Trifolium medium]